MSLKKAFCPYCHTSEEKYQIFDVNAEAEVCYCPHCMAKLEPAEAIKAYDNFINKKINQAKIILYSAIDFERAYEMFAHILEIDPTNVEGLYGRLLSLLYMSTLRRTRFKDFMLLFDEEKSLFREKNNAESYLSFLNRIANAVNEYDVLFRKRIMIHQYFYDIDCIKLYFSHIQDMHDLKADLKEEVTFLFNQNPNNKGIKDALSGIEKSIKTKDIELTKKWLTADGYSYGYVGMSNTNDVLLGRQDKQNVVKIAHYHPKALMEDKAKNGHRLIHDEVYPNNLFWYRLMKVSLPLLISFLILAIGAGVGAIFVRVQPYFAILISVTCIFFGVAVLFLILFLVSYQKLDKRHRLTS